MTLLKACQFYEYVNVVYMYSTGTCEDIEGNFTLLIDKNSYSGSYISISGIDTKSSVDLEDVYELFLFYGFLVKNKYTFKREGQHMN